MPNYYDYKIKENYFKKKYKISDEMIVLGYHGIICKDRGIENIIRIVEKNKDTVGFIIGNANNDNYIKDLKEIVNNSEANNRVFFHERVEFNELYKYISCFDIGIVLIKPNTDSYKYALPNKLFENIQAMNPIIGSNLPEISKIINKYKIGYVIDYKSDEEFEMAIKKIIKRKKNYYNKNLIKAKNELCWEKEKSILINAIEDL